jgi:hypothetical protein
MRDKVGIERKRERLKDNGKEKERKNEKSYRQEWSSHSSDLLDWNPGEGGNELPLTDHLLQPLPLRKLLPKAVPENTHHQ